MPRSVAIVLAGGAGVRLGRPGNKVYVELEGRPLLAYALAAFEASGEIDDIVLVVRSGEHEAARHAVADAGARKTIAVVSGGVDRQGSERAGLAEIRTRIDRGEVDLVAIHDGARPFPSVRLIGDIVAMARRIGGAVPGVDVDEPLYTGDIGAPRRVDKHLVRMQTPQAFHARPLLAAYDAAARDPAFSAVDTAETIERFGRLTIAVVPGERHNIKVTTPADMPVARRLVQAVRESPGGAAE